MEQPMRIEGVSRPDSLEIEDQPVGPGDVGHSVDPDLGVARGGAIFLGESSGVPGRTIDLARSRRIELERAPNDFDGVAVGEASERGLEVALADVAPRAGDVRPNVDAELLHDGEA